MTRNILPMQPGDVPIIYADVDDLMSEVGFVQISRLKMALRILFNGNRICCVYE